MKFLVDTHTFLWMAAAPERLSQRARDICETAELVFSVASAREIGIKWRTGRVPLPCAPRDFISQQIKRAAGLPMLRPGLNKDPFGRMPAAQCLEEDLQCVTRDPAIAAYGIKTIWD